MLRSFVEAGIRSVKSTDSVPHPTNAIALDGVLADALRRELQPMSVTLRFCGAARTVTGSCYLFETPAGRLLVDCGLFQGPKTLKELNYGAFPFAPGDIHAVLLTHAHIDHSGLIPKLVRGGFRGRIWATRGTIDLCSCMLPDAGSIQESEVAALNRRNVARGRQPVKPIYTQADAVAALDAFRPIEYENWFEPMPGVRARYWNAGHLLGSASIELDFAGEGAAGKPLRVLASGDIGPDAKLLQPIRRRRPDSTTCFANRPTAAKTARRSRANPAGSASPRKCARRRRPMARCSSPRSRSNARRS